MKAKAMRAAGQNPRGKNGEEKGTAQLDNAEFMFLRPVPP